MFHDAPLQPTGHTPDTKGYVRMDAMHTHRHIAPLVACMSGCPHASDLGHESCPAGKCPHQPGNLYYDAHLEPYQHGRGDRDA